MTFSLVYRKENDDDSYAVDWNMKGDRRWTQSSKEAGFGHGWEGAGRYSLDKESYLFLIKIFELDEKKFPLEKLVTMSPRELAKIGGPNPSPRGDNLGDNRQALEVDD